MQAEELAALRIIKEHDDAELKAYKKKVADEIEEVHAKYEKEHKLLEKYEDN